MLWALTLIALINYTGVVVRANDTGERCVRGGLKLGWGLRGGLGCIS